MVCKKLWTYLDTNTLGGGEHSTPEQYIGTLFDPCRNVHTDVPLISEVLKKILQIDDGRGHP